MADILEKITKDEQEQIQNMLNESWGSLQHRLSPQWHRVHFNDVIQVGSHTILLVNESGIHLIDPGWDKMESLAGVIYAVKKYNKPLSAVFLTHRHIDHYYNLKYYLYLAELEPKLFSFTLISDDKNRDLSGEQKFLGFCQDEEFIKLDGRQYFMMKTPGHNMEDDHFAVMEMNHKILFVGDLLQPQGESYEYGTFLTPVSNHYHPEEVNQSIQLLKSLPFEHCFSGHGEYLDISRAFRWMEVTQKTLERTSFFCRKVVWEENSGELVQNAKRVYLMLAMERNMPLEPLYARFEGPLGQSDFELYDLPSIAYYLKKFGM